MPRDEPEKAEKYALRSVSRALDVLQALAAGDQHGLGVGEIATAIGVSRSTAFTLLQTLTARGFVADARLGGGRRYRLGLALLDLGDKAASGMSLTQIAEPFLQQLTDESKLTSRLAILDEGYAVTIRRVDGPGIFRLMTSLGRRELPHCSAVGKSLLSDLPADAVTKLLNRIGMPRRTEHTITTPAGLLESLQWVRKHGYALDDEEDSIGVVCVGAPIRDRSGAIVAAISVTTIKIDKNADEIDRLGEIVRRYAALISGSVGAASQPF